MTTAGCVLLAIGVLVCSVAGDSAPLDDRTREVDALQPDQSLPRDVDKQKALLKETQGVHVHFGMCDASAGIALRGGMFVAANDEDNTLRLYRADRHGEPVASFDLSRYLEVGPAQLESDLEGAVRIKDRIYWIGSHGRNRNGHWRRGRHVFFATDIHDDGQAIELKPTGAVHRKLVYDILAEPMHHDLKLERRIQPDDSVDADLAPKEKGFNIESLAAAPNGEGFLIGLRNPQRKKKAIVLWLVNPDAMIKGEQPAKWKQPLLFDLDKRGVRSMSYVSTMKKYVLIAGPHDGEHRFAYYTWSGKRADQPRLVREIKPSLLNPEAMLVHADGRPQILSDNGGTMVGNQTCKSLSDVAKRRFFSRFIKLKPDSETSH